MTIRIGFYSQSNGVFANSTPTFPISKLRTGLNALFAGVDTFELNVQILNPSSGPPTPGTQMGGTAITRTGTSSNCWMQDDGIPANRASWIDTTIGALGRDYVTTTLTPTQRSECKLLVVYWWEYDSKTGGGGADSAPQLDAAYAEYLGTRIRADYGKTAAQLPILLVGPSVYLGTTFAGQDVVSQAFDMLVARAGENFHRFPCLTRDVYWGRDTSPDGGLTGTDYTTHATEADLFPHMRRLARYIAHKWGPEWGLTAKYSGRGPEIQWVEYVDATTLDVWVQHDGGNDLQLGANSNTALAFTLWNILVSGVRTLPTAVAIPSTGPGAGRRVRLTMPTMYGPKSVLLKHGHYIRDFISSGTMYQRGGLDGAVVDNSDTYQPTLNLVLPAAFTGADRVPMPIREMRDYMRARVGPPPTA